MSFWDHVKETGELELCASGEDTNLELLAEIEVPDGLVISKGN